MKPTTPNQIIQRLKAAKKKGIKTQTDNKPISMTLYSIDTPNNKSRLEWTCTKEL